MAGKLLVVAVIFFIAPIATRAQGFVTSNAYVEADVSNDGQGLVRELYAGTNHEATLSFIDNTSFLTVLVNGKYYTNDRYIPLSSKPPAPVPSPTFPSAYLEKGATKKIADTIETVWQPEGPNAFDIVQDIYPVAFPLAGSGQIVYKFSIRNHEDSALSAQAQYLLDIDISTPDTVNDNAPVTTRYGYIDNWLSFPNQTIAAIPPYYVATLYPIGHRAFPGYTSGPPTGGMGVGYNNDSLAPEPMGLMQPATFTFVDWPTIVAGTPDYTWGFPATPSSAVTDEALLIQWPANGVGAGDTLELGRGSYGTPACMPMCAGNLQAMTFHPDHIVWNDSSYVPNRFPVDAVVWNTESYGEVSANGTQAITNSVTQAQSGPVKIVSPLPTDNNGYSQSQNLPGLKIPSHSAVAFTWEDTVLAAALYHCSTDSSYDLTAIILSEPLGGINPCSCPIIVDCEDKPYITPMTTVRYQFGSYDGSFCNARCTEVVAFDTGSIRIPVLSVVADTLTNMRLSVAPNHAGADSTFYTVCVIDSMLNGSATVTITDTLGNSAVEQYEYCTIPDTLAPLVKKGNKYDTAAGPIFYISDDQPWDRGLDTIIVTNLANLRIDASYPPDLVVRGLPTAWISLVSDGSGEPETLCIQAIDLAGNKTDTCFTFGTAGVVDATPMQISLSIAPNPSSGDVTIFIEGAPSADVEVFDVLGREVDRFRVDVSYDWQTSRLPAGMYIVRAQIGSTIITKKVIK